VLCGGQKTAQPQGCGGLGSDLGLRLSRQRPKHTSFEVSATVTVVGAAVPVKHSEKFTRPNSPRPRIPPCSLSSPYPNLNRRHLPRLNSPPSRDVAVATAFVCRSPAPSPRLAAPQAVTAAPGRRPLPKPSLASGRSPAPSRHARPR
jgi:hypothetical protein